jgi:hypothetical protein
MSPPTPTRAPISDRHHFSPFKSHRAKTPIISAIASSATVIAIWTFIFCAWLWKQYKKRVRAKRRAAKGLPPKIKQPKKPLPTFIVPPDPAVITGLREPGERAIPRKHNSMDKDGNTPTSIELNERNRPISEDHAHDEMIARQIFAKHSPLDPPKHDKRHTSKCTSLALSPFSGSHWFVSTNDGLTRLTDSRSAFIYFTPNFNHDLAEHPYPHIFLSFYLCTFIVTHKCTPR